MNTFAQHTYTFHSEVQQVSVSEKLVELRTNAGFVHIEAVPKVGLRVRYSFGQALTQVFSYASVHENPATGVLSVSERENFLTIKAEGLTAHISKKPYKLHFTDESGFVLHEESFGAGTQSGKITHITKKSETIQYYGLGEKTSNINRTGRVFTNWNSDIPGYRKDEDPIYKSFPFYIGLEKGRAYGVYYDNSFKSEFDFGARLKEHMGFQADGGELRFYVFAGPGFSDVLERYTTLTGRSQLPPRWALGYQQSRWGYYPDTELYLLAEQFRKREIPCDVLYVDIDYMDGYRVFTWNKEYFPEPKNMLTTLKEKGFRVVPIIDPGIKNDPNFFAQREGIQNDVFVKWPDGSNYIGDVWPGKTLFPDYSNPKARKWWGELFKINLEEGIEGFWTDMNEPAVFGGKTMPDIVVFDKDGQKSSHLEMHNLYGFLMARATHEGLTKLEPNKRPFVITRAAFSGVQRYSSVWTGDNSAHWDDVYLAMPMVMGLGLAGVPFAGHDIGGFIGSPDGEMYMRSLQIGALMPFSRSHTVIDSERQEPWSYGQMYEYINREAIRLRYKLLPNLYTAFYQHTQTGAPIIRPLLWDDQTDEQLHWLDDQFMLGDHFMVAPVVTKGANERSVYFPKGTWYNFFTGQQVTGGVRRTISAPIVAVDVYGKVFDQPLKGLPLFVRAGAVVVEQEWMHHTGEKKLEKATLHAYTGNSATSMLYEDDGASMAYKNGVHKITRFITKDAARSFELEIQATGSYAEGYSSYNLVIYGLTKAPKEVKVDGKKVTSQFDEHMKLHLNLSATSQKIVISK